MPQLVIPANTNFVQSIPNDADQHDFSVRGVNFGRSALSKRSISSHARRETVNSPLNLDGGTRKGRLPMFFLASKHFLLTSGLF